MIYILHACRLGPTSRNADSNLHYLVFFETTIVRTSTLSRGGASSPTEGSVKDAWGQSDHELVCMKQGNLLLA
jgi:hypothetical protein